MNKQELSEKINQTEHLLNELKAELNQLEKKQKEPKFERVPYSDAYFVVEITNTMPAPVAYKKREKGSSKDEFRFGTGNYFLTKDRAEEVADKIKFLLKVERFHDLYCPDYVDWEWFDCKADKYYIYYDGDMKEYCVDRTETYINPTVTYFPNDKTAQKVCDMLNKELKKEQ